MAVIDAVEGLSKIYQREGVLTLYASVDPTISYRRGNEVAAAKSALRTLERSLAVELRPQFERERDTALRFLERERTGQSPTVAIFSSEHAGLWETISLNVHLPTQASFAHRPRILPLLMVADEQGRYCVVFVNKDESRLLMISMGNVEEDRSISDEVPGRHDQGGWSQARYQRHHDFHVVEHLKRTLTALNDYLKSRPFQRLIVAGPEEVAAEFTSLLPTPLMDRLVATVPSPARVSREEMMEAIMPAIEGFERSEEEALIHRVSELADAGGNAVLGMETTLRAVGDGRVHELALAEGISAAGQECLGCGYLDAENLADCPRCGSRLERVEDIVERAAESVYAQGGRVEVLFGEARESLIARGGLGALLRF